MPSPNLNTARSTSTELQIHNILAVGGSSAVTKVAGNGVAVTPIDSGDYKLVWSQDPGKLVGVICGLQATTMGALAGHTIIPGAFVPQSGSTKASMLVNVFNASDASHDLAALEWFTVTAMFSYSNLDIV